MPDAATVNGVYIKWQALVEDLDERGRRRWAATEAIALGRGGIAAVSEATGISDRTIRNGVKEIQSGVRLPKGYQRAKGGGRKSLEFHQPDIVEAIELLVEPTERGDPQSSLRWTCKSIANLVGELREQGYRIGQAKVRKVLKALGYSLQGNRKTREGKDHPDRDAQFRHIQKRTSISKRAGRPAISVDTKKKETLGNKANVGRELRPKGNPIEVDTHDFPDPELGKAVPYGVYDIGKNNAFVSIGISKDTAEFAAESIRRWWNEMGFDSYSSAKRILITADCGGSNGYRNRLWKYELQTFADETGLIVEVCHFPPGTSKWNKVEHRLFCHITRNWRGVPLETHEIVVNLVGATRTAKGLEVHCWLDTEEYFTGRKISDAEMNTINLKPNQFHGEWNYEIHPRRAKRIR